MGTYEQRQEIYGMCKAYVTESAIDEKYIDSGAYVLYRAILYLPDLAYDQGYEYVLYWMESRGYGDKKSKTGDEYVLIESGDGYEKECAIWHKTCGTITKMRYESFIHGTRCALCTQIITSEELKNIEAN